MEHVFHNCGSSVLRLWNTFSTAVVLYNTSDVVTINMHSCDNYIMAYSFLYARLSASLRPLASTEYSGECPFLRWKTTENTRKWEGEYWSLKMIKWRLSIIYAFIGGCRQICLHPAYTLAYTTVLGWYIVRYKDGCRRVGRNAEKIQVII